MVVMTTVVGGTTVVLPLPSLSGDHGRRQVVRARCRTPNRDTDRPPGSLTEVGDPNGVENRREVDEGSS